MYLAIDIGGTKTLLALFSNRGRVLKRLKFLTNKNPKTFTKSLSQNLQAFFPENRIRTLETVVVAIAGPVDSNYNAFIPTKNKVPLPPSDTPILPTTFGRPLGYGNLDWQGFAFTREIEKCIKNLFKNNRCKLPKSAPKISIFGTTSECCPIYIMNDANLATIFECQKLKGRSIYLTFSTGIGGGICEDGKLDLAKSDAFEPGHSNYYSKNHKYYSWQGRKCEYEDIASANAIKQVYGIQATDVKGIAAYQDIALRVSTGLTDIIKDYHPKTIVIGGALGFQLKNFRKYLIPILAVSLNCRPDSLPKFIPAKYPLESVIHGCYVYASQKSKSN